MIATSDRGHSNCRPAEGAIGRRIARLLAALVAASMTVSLANAQEAISRSITSINDDRGREAMALELSLTSYQRHASPRQHGNFFVDIDIAPGSAEESVIRFVDLARKDKEAAMADIFEPVERSDSNEPPCGCGSHRRPTYHVPDTFKTLSFRYAWLYQDYKIILVEFRKSARSSTSVFIATRVHNGKSYIASRPRDDTFDAISELLSLARSPGSASPATDTVPDHLRHAVQIAGGLNPITVHFDGTGYSRSAGWRRASETRPANRAATFASTVLATSQALGDDDFLELIHPWVSDSARSRAGRDADFLDEMRSMHAATSEIAHVFTIAVGRRHVHTYVTREQPDRLRNMIIMEDGRTLALAGIPPGGGLQSLMAHDVMQQYLLDLWRR